MRRVPPIRRLAIALFACIALAPDLTGAQGRDAFTDLAERVTARLGGAPARIVFLGIADPSGVVSPLDRYLGDKLAAALVAPGRVTLTDEAARQAALAEIKVNLADVFDRETAQTAGRLTGAAWIVKGVAYVFEASRRAEITLQVVRIETGEYWLSQGEVPLSAAALALRPRETVMPAVAGKRPPLELEIAVIASRPSAQGRARFLGVVREGERLRSNDDVKIHFRTNADAYVYVVWVDTHGKATLQFPSRDAGSDNQVQGGRVHSAPQKASDWYFLDGHTGAETLYLVASYERLTDLTALLRRAEAGTLREAKEVTMELERLFGDLRERGAAGVRPGATHTVAVKDAASATSAQFSVVRGYAQAIRRLTFHHDP